MPLIDGFDYETTPRTLPDDVVDRETTALIRLWNRSEHASRREFLDMLEDSDGGIIDL